MKKTTQDGKNKTIAVIGGGASGLFCAGVAANETALSGKDIKVILIEKNRILGKKLLVTGKGRCNVTNDSPLPVLIENVPVNGNFLYSAFSAFSSVDAMAFFESRGVPLKTERGRRVFPVSNRALDIRDALCGYCRDGGVHVLCAEAVGIDVSDGRASGVLLKDGREIPADVVVVATGGLSYPKTGSTGDGYRFAKELGHTVTELSPSLVPLVSPDPVCREMMGLSLKNVGLKIMSDAKKPLYEDQGEMLFTHFGLSGPMVLSASAHIREYKGKKVRAVIDLKPGLSEEKLDLRLRRDFQKYAGKDFANSLFSLLPATMIPAVVKKSGVFPHIRTGEVTREQRGDLLKVLKGFEIEISGPRDVEEAIITLGGVKVAEVSSSTMESKIVRGLYFVGEVLDVDAYTGGFNLQIAFSTGYLAGKKSVESV